MMDEETQKIIREQMESLPKVVRNAILESGWEEKILALAKRYSLHIDQTGALQNETFMVMLGLDAPENFSENLVRDLGLSSLIATQISMEVNEIIFKPIRIELQKLEAEEENAEQNPTKESVLEGIEHPVETVHPHEAFKPMASQLELPGPLDTGTALPAPSPAPAAKPERIPVYPVTYNQQYEIYKTPPKPGETPEVSSLPKVTVMPHAGTSNIVHDRLSQMVQMAKKEINTGPAPEKPKDAPRSAVDPYREAIN